MVLSELSDMFMGWSGSMLVFMGVSCLDSERHTSWLFLDEFSEENSPSMCLESTSIIDDVWKVLRI